MAALARGTREVPATAQCQITPDVVGEELNQLITKHLGPKANLFDYSDAAEALMEAGHRLDEEANTRFSDNEVDAWVDANVPSD